MIIVVVITSYRARGRSPEEGAPPREGRLQERLSLKEMRPHVLKTGLAIQLHVEQKPGTHG